MNLFYRLYQMKWMRSMENEKYGLFEHWIEDEKLFLPTIDIVSLDHTYRIADFFSSQISNTNFHRLMPIMQY